MSTYPISIGIDPGWKTLGLSVVRNTGNRLELLSSETLNPSELGLVKTVDHVLGVISEDCQVHMERYVGYSGVVSKDSEYILMMIGALQYGLLRNDRVRDLALHRAIDWKTELVKLLFKKRGFTNPSLKLDKKFSIAAAKSCVETTGVKSNHEADSICMASLPFIRQEADLPIKSMGRKGNNAS